MPSATNEVDLVGIDAGQLDEDRQRVIGAEAVDVRAEARAQAREARHLPEVGEQLLDLLLELVHVPLPLHVAEKRTHARNLLGMQRIRRLLKARSWPRSRCCVYRLVRGRAAWLRASSAASERARAMIERWTRWVLHHRKSVLAVWIGLFVIGGWAASGLSTCSRTASRLPGTDAGRAENILHDHFGQKSTGSFTLVAAHRRQRGRDRPRVARGGDARGEASCRRAASSAPGRVAARGDGVDRLVARPCRREGPHRRDARGGRDDSRRAALRHRPGGDRARPRPRLLARPQGRRALHRDPDRVPAARSSSSGRSRSCCRCIFAAGLDPGHARDRLDLREEHGALDLHAEHGDADRPRHRGRLLAADGLPLPGGAPRAALARGGRRPARWRRPGAPSSSAAPRSRSGSRCCSSCRCRSCAASASASRSRSSPSSAR